MIEKRELGIIELEDLKKGKKVKGERRLSLFSSFNFIVLGARLVV
jgi:hypothetical protein